MNEIIFKNQPQEYKVVALRECPVPAEMDIFEEAKHAYDYWIAHIASSPQFSPDTECCVVLLLNTRRRIKGHQLIALGCLDSIIVFTPEKLIVLPLSRHLRSLS